MNNKLTVLAAATLIAFTGAAQAQETNADGSPAAAAPSASAAADNAKKVQEVGATVMGWLKKGKDAVVNGAATAASAAEGTGVSVGDAAKVAGAKDPGAAAAKLAQDKATAAEKANVKKGADAAAPAEAASAPDAKKIIQGIGGVLNLFKK